MFEKLKAQVEATVGVIASAIAFIAGLHEQLTAALAADDESGEQSAVQEIVDQLAAAQGDLAAAIAANNPVTQPLGDPLPVNDMVNVQANQAAAADPVLESDPAVLADSAAVGEPGAGDSTTG